MTTPFRSCVLLRRIGERNENRPDLRARRISLPARGETGKGKILAMSTVLSSGAVTGLS
jgi:hypothetical protein